MEGDWQQLYEDLCQIAPPSVASPPAAADPSDPMPEEWARCLYKQAIAVATELKHGAG